VDSGFVMYNRLRVGDVHYRWIVHYFVFCVENEKLEL